MMWEQSSREGPEDVVNEDKPIWASLRKENDCDTRDQTIRKHADTLETAKPSIRKVEKDDSSLLRSYIEFGIQLT